MLNPCLADCLKEVPGCCVQILELPPEIDFADYSSVTTRGNVIAIASQEDSRMWLGRLNVEETKISSKKAHSTVVLEEPEKLEVMPGTSLARVGGDLGQRRTLYAYEIQ